MDFVNFNSVENIPGIEARAAFSVSSASVFKEDVDVDSTYYPIPYYAAIFKGKWYDIKQLIGIAKEAKLRNSAPIKYHIEISAKYWESIFRAEGITDRRKQQERLQPSSL